MAPDAEATEHLERVLKNAAEAQFEIFSLCLSGGTEVNHGKSQVSWPPCATLSTKDLFGTANTCALANTHTHILTHIYVYIYIYNVIIS
jgi:hypothetical protein